MIILKFAKNIYYFKILITCFVSKISIKSFEMSSVLDNNLTFEFCNKYLSQFTLI